ncbi:type I polyketide synthase [Lentzea alba]|uniref:type I polyketide synthase n=1 Tax=Lentzea alba TaxID=2714351 RepID=UPI0039BF71F5
MDLQLTPGCPGSLTKTSSRQSDLEMNLSTETAVEPIAVVSAACRYPGGVESPADLWKVVQNEICTTSAMPTDRGWDFNALFADNVKQSGTSSTKFGHFVENGAHFDAEFFGMSEREAKAMHPAHRLAMTVAWEAVERMGVDPLSLRGHDVGVFVGAASPEYAMRWHEAPNDVRGRVMTGTTSSVMSGRLSYFFGFTGPSLTVDTACSASSVAIHLACQSLRTGESVLALAGGASYHSQPGTFTEFTKQRGLSPDGTCKAFAEAADGTAWGEGAGMVVLARLSDAIRMNYPVLAVIRGSAVNSDGASSTLTAPNGTAQEQVIRRALTQAGLTAGDIDAVEAHGTGTKLGDPIEAKALMAVYGERDAADPLWLGSLKSNIGHTIAAAGIGGLLKMIMAIRAGVLPRTLHVDKPTSRMDWSAGTIRVLQKQQPWPRVGRPRRAAVSAFGISGTNSHIILEEAPDRHQAVAHDSCEPLPWVLSGRTPGALRQQAARLSALLTDQPDMSLRDIGFSLATGRTHFDHRAAVIGTTPEDFQRGLETIVQENQHDNDEPGTTAVVMGAEDHHDGVVLVFPGQGSQWTGMAVELADASEIFAAHLRECADALAPHCEWSLMNVLRQEEGAPSLNRVDVVQPALFAVMIALARFWQSCGVRIATVVGHSQGEIAAACVAGALSVEDGARIVVTRSKVLTALDNTHGMAAVALSAAETGHALKEHVGLDVAVINGPTACVVGGPTAALAALVAELDEKDIPARVLPVDYASHTAQVEQIESLLLASFPDLSPSTSTVPFCSTVTGEIIDTACLTSEYWYRNLRKTVRFDEAVRTVLDGGHRVFVEASPHPTLVRQIMEIARDNGVDDCVVIDSLHKEDGGYGSYLRSLCQAHVHGIPVDWSVVFASGGNRVELPTYPFQNQRLWLDDLDSRGASSAGLDGTGHPWLSSAVTLADGSGHLATGRISLTTSPWLADHTVHRRAVLPGAAIAEMMITAGRALDCATLNTLMLSRPLVLPDEGALRIQLLIGQTTAEGRTARLFSRADDAADDVPWNEHATAVLTVGDAVRADELALPDGAERVDSATLYSGLADSGIDYGLSFRRVVSAHRAGNTVYADVSLPTELRGDHTRFSLHPVLFDAALHAVGFAVDNEGDGTALLPFEWSGIRLKASDTMRLRVRVDVLDGRSCRVVAADSAGVPVLSVDSLTVAPSSGLRLGSASDSLLVPRWRPIVTTSRENCEWVAVGAAPASDLTSYQNLAEVRDAVPDGCTAPEVVIFRVAAGDDHRAPVLTVLSVLREWLNDELFGDSRLIVLTSGAVAALPQDVPDPGLAAVWGLVRSAQSESPGRFVLIDHDGLGDTTELLREALGAGEPQLAIRASEVLAFRLERGGAAEGDAAARSASGTVLITGGTGTLGGTIAKHLVARHGVRKLVLTSRSGRQANGADHLVADLTAAGATVEVISCDLARRDQTEALLRSLSANHELTAVVHCAGVLADSLVESLTADKIETVMAPKADAARHLDELTRDAGLGAFVLFSSAAGVFGSVGQGNYAAANAYLDALAQRRRAEGFVATSLAWGLWEQRSALTANVSLDSLSKLAPGVHIAPLVTEDALELFDSAWCSDEAVLVPVRLQESREQEVAASIRGLVRKESRNAVPAESSSRVSEAVSLEHMAGLTDAERETTLLNLVLETAAAVLGKASITQVAARRPFRELGMDSLSAVELRNRLSTTIGKHLPAAVIFDHPSAAKLAGYLNGLLAGRSAPRSDAPEPSGQSSTSKATNVEVDELDVDELIALSMRTVESTEGNR